MGSSSNFSTAGAWSGTQANPQASRKRPLVFSSHWLGSAMEMNFIQKSEFGIGDSVRQGYSIPATTPHSLMP
jgi:hypothetical protein